MRGRTNTYTKTLAGLAVALSGALTLYELTWWGTSGVARVLVGFGIPSRTSGFGGVASARGIHFNQFGLSGLMLTRGWWVRAWFCEVVDHLLGSGLLTPVRRPGQKATNACSTA